MKTIERAAILALTLTLGALLIQNRAPVQTHLLMVTVELPRILLLLLATGGGFALGLFVALVARANSTPKSCAA